MLMPAPYEESDWYPSFSRFMTAACPSWYGSYKCAPAARSVVKKLAEQFAPDVPRLPEEYGTFLAQIGTQGLNLQRRAWLYPSNQLYLSEGEEPCLMIGSYSLLDEGDKLAYCFPEEGPPCLVWMERWSDLRDRQIKVADSLGQLLCNQAFLAEGGKQFSFHHSLELAFHLHQPLYGPCPEAEDYCRTHPIQNLSEKELEDIGFQLQIKKLEGPLRRLSYERVWFSTELDQVWRKEAACCILSREFDPNDMFDTVYISLWGMGKESVWELAQAFQELGYGNSLELRDGFT